MDSLSFQIVRIFIAGDLDVRPVFLRPDGRLELPPGDFFPELLPRPGKPEGIESIIPRRSFAEKWPHQSSISPMISRFSPAHLSD